MIPAIIIAHVIIGMFETAGDVLALTARVEKDAITGNYQDLAQVSQQAKQKAAAIITKIQTAYATMQTVFEDPETRSLLENFAEQYYQNSDGLMLLQDIGTVTGGMIPAILLAVISKNPEALGTVAAEISSADIIAAGTTIEDIVKTEEELAKCQGIGEADVDQSHELNLKHVGLIESAQKLQTDSAYNADEYTVTKLSKGSKVIGGLPGQTEFYTDEQSLSSSNLSRSALFKGLQVAPHEEKSYRPKVGLYEINEDIEVPFGSAKKMISMEKVV